MNHRQPLDGGHAVGNSFNLKSFTFQYSERSLLNGGTVVGNQNNPSHGTLLYCATPDLYEKYHDATGKSRRNRLGILSLRLCSGLKGLNDFLQYVKVALLFRWLRGCRSVGLTLLGGIFRGLSALVVGAGGGRRGLPRFQALIIHGRGHDGGTRGRRGGLCPRGFDSTTGSSTEMHWAEKCSAGIRSAGHDATQLG